MTSPARAAVILQYHHVSDSTPPSTSIKVDEFAAHMRYLKDNNFTVRPLPEVIQQLQQGNTLPKKTVVITFDDGYRNVYTNATPILERYGFPYTLFVAPGDINKNHAGMMTWQQLAALGAKGVTIANHSSYHHHLNRRLYQETLPQWQQRITRDLDQAEQQIRQHTGQSWQYLAYPYGEYNLELTALIKKLGYVGIGQHSGAIASHSDFTALPRYPASGRYANLDKLKLKLHSLAMPVVALENHDPQLHNDFQPKLTVTIDPADIHTKLLTCYIVGQRVNPTWLSSDTFSIQAGADLPVGRSRYNCTAPSKSSGQYYWFSQPWMRANPDGSWYAN